MSVDISPKQRRILRYIDSFSQRYGFPPTLREICKHFGISSTNGARYHLHKLREKGYLEITRYRSRGVKRRGRATRPKQKTYQLPVLGGVPAGPTDYAASDIREGDVIIDPEFFGRRGNVDLFGLRIKGDSMIEAGIHNGDVVIVLPQSNANDGDIVVARIDDEATVKTLRRKNKQVHLEPANPNYEPIVLSEENGNGHDIALVGIVVGLIRSL